MASSSSYPPPRDKLPTVIQNLGEETAAGPQDNTVTKADFIPTQLAHYKVLHKLGQGGMGWVLLSEDTQLNRKVALKVMRGRLAADQESRERFVREARAAAQLRHDNIITIYQVGEERNIPFFAMELLEGGTLQQRLEYPKPLSIGAAVRIAREIAQGLQAAHERGVIHRDIKPANIWLEAPRGRVKILDFGLARQADAKSGLTHAGEIVGTPHYMSPEQARGRAIDPRTDLFSLGCILYRTTTGKLPFAGETLLATLTAIAVDTPAPVCGLNPNVPHALADLIERLLSKDPAARPASAADVIEELTTIERDLAPGNRSGFSIEVPPAILVQTRPKADAQPVAAPQVVVPPKAPSGRPRRPVAKVLPLAPGPARQVRWPWIVAIGLVAVLGLLLVVALLWLAGSLLSLPPEPSTASIRPLQPDLRAVVPLEGSVAASKTAAEWALAGGGLANSVEVKISGKDGSTIISAVAQLPSEPYALVGVEFRGSRALTDDDLAKLDGVTTLGWLDLSDTKISDQGIAHLNHLTLTILKLEQTEVTDAGLARLVEHCPMLKRLHIGQTSCTPAVIQSLGALHSLEELSLRGLPIADAQLKQLQSLPCLKVLNLQGTQITDQGLRELGVLTDLSTLVLDETPVTDKGLATIVSWGRLESLSLNDCQLTDDSLALLAKLPRLNWLEIKDNEQLDDAGLANLAASRGLDHLALTNGQFSQAARKKLQRSLPRCEIKLIDPGPL